MSRFLSGSLLATLLAVLAAVPFGLYAQSPSAPVVRLTGIVEAETSAAVLVPRLSGRGFSQLTLMKLVPGGTTVRERDVLMELDPQDQIREAFNRRIEVSDLNGQIDRTLATQAVTRSQDDTAIVQARHDVDRAKLEVSKNALIPKVDAEKNDLLLEQAEARLTLLRETYDLKRTAATADLRILEIRRDRAQNALENAEKNAELMVVRSPIAGLAVLKTTFRAGTMGEFQEGDLVRTSQAVLDVIDPARMRVRARINQADIARVAVGQRARVRLDAYPGLEFDGVVSQIAPLAVPSQRNPRVRTFTALVAIDGSHPNLLPDLTASIELLPHTGGSQ
jgi:HlyD family secretion protein